MASITWLLTFCCYGNWLPGDRRGYVKRSPDGRTFRAAPNGLLEAWAALRLPRPPFLMDAAARGVVDASIREQCARERWTLHALHVRTNHLHLVVSSNESPERVMTHLKARATRQLREAADRRRHAALGATR